MPTVHKHDRVPLEHSFTEQYMGIFSQHILMLDSEKSISSRVLEHGYVSWVCLIQLLLFLCQHCLKLAQITFFCYKTCKMTIHVKFNKIEHQI